MYTLRCTRKLLKRLGAQPSSEAVAPATVLGDWYANLLFTRPQQLVLAMNERSLLCVLVPAAPGHQLGRRLRDAVSELLLAIGVPAAAVTAEAAAMESMAIGATSLYLTENIYSLTGYQTPRLRALELFGVTSGVVRLQRGPWLH